MSQNQSNHSISKPKAPIEQIDFYFNQNGFMVFTEKYLLERGFCCMNGCKHCPYQK